MEQTFIKINKADTVVVCLQPIAKGTTISVDGKDIVTNQDTPAGHKILIEDTPLGADIIKYGYPIGHAKTNLKAGDWVRFKISGSKINTFPDLGRARNIYPDDLKKLD